jgi:hypothetical protein
LLQEIKLSVTPGNIRAVAAAIECEVQDSKSLSAAYEFVLAGTLDAIDERWEINAFFFTDAKYRAERRNSHGAEKKTTEREAPKASLNYEGDDSGVI